MANKSFPDQIIEAKEKFIEHCKVCGSCLKGCRIRPLAAYADHDPVELQKIRIDFLKGGEFSQAVYDLAFSCTGCHFCSEVCEQGLDPSRMGILLRTELESRGHSAPPMYSFILPGERYNYMSILSALLLNPSETRWLTELPDSPEHADVVYFPGCALHTSPDRLFASLDILDRMNLNHVTLGGIAFCCGAPYMAAGRSAECSEYGNRFVESVSAFTPETLVLFCSGCTIRMKGGFAASSESSFRTAHLATFLGENLDRLKFKNPLNRTVTIHDPCHLGRGLGEFEGVRKVLSAIPGIRIVEMEHCGKDSLCCARSAASTEPEAARTLGLGILDEAKATGADILVDLCLGCDSVLRNLGKDYPFEVVSFVTLVGRAMGIEYEDKLSLYLQWRDAERVIDDARANIEASSYSEDEVRSFLHMLFSMM